MNLKPLLVYRNLGLREVNLNTISLLLVEWFIKHPREILDDVLVNIDKFIFLVDFIKLDIEEDQ